MNAALKQVDTREDLQDFIEDHISINGGIDNTSWLKSGELEIGGELHAWKSRYFGFKENQQELYFFRASTKNESVPLKIKGVISLRYCRLFDVHESYFQKRYCFQLIPCDQAGNLTDEVEKITFLAAENEEEKGLRYI